MGKEEEEWNEEQGEWKKEQGEWNEEQGEWNEETEEPSVSDICRWRFLPSIPFPFFLSLSFPPFFFPYSPW